MVLLYSVGIWLLFSPFMANAGFTTFLWIVVAGALLGILLNTKRKTFHSVVGAGSLGSLIMILTSGAVGILGGLLSFVVLGFGTTALLVKRK
tara:strand:- start:1006 stop:1281 length:276 start_codon:yes stop_codon:yes gene_type:complete